MALSGTINGSTNNSNYSLYANWTATQNTTANTSTVTVKVYLKSGGYSTISNYWSCVINRSTVTTNKSATVSTTAVLLGEKTFTVNHNSDGTASTTISFSFSNKVTAGTYTVSSGSGSATITLDTIPRSSTFSLSATSGTLGSTSFTVSITKLNSAYTHTVQYTFGSSTTTVSTKTTSTSVSFTPPLSLASQIPNATSGTATVKLITYNGSTQMGSTTKTITLNVPSSVVPTTGISITASNQTNGVNVAKETFFTVKASSPTGAYGSTIKYYFISAGSYTSSTSSLTTGTLDAGTYTFRVKVQDSRGRTAEATQTVNVYGYIAPTLSSVKAYRSNNDGTASSDGVYISVKFTWAITNLGNTNTNAKQYSVQYKLLTDSNFTTAIAYTTLSAYSGTTTVTLPNTVSTVSTYSVKVLLKDSQGVTESATLKVPTVSALLNIEQDGIGVGKIHENGKLDVGGDVYTTGAIHCGTYVWLNNDPNQKVRFGYEASTTDAYLSNSANNWLRLKADKTMTYAGYKVYTAYDKPTASDLGFLPSSVTTGSNTQGLTLQAWDSSTYGALIPNADGSVYLGSNTNKYYVVYATNGTINTSDKNHKAIIDDTNLNDCFDMIKNTPVYNYVMLSGDKTQMSEIEYVENTLENSGKQESIQVGIMAQDILDYDCSKYILVESEDGYGINNYSLTSAIMGALKIEIEKREELEEKVNSLEDENIQLKQRLEAIEKALNIGGEE